MPAALETLAFLIGVWEGSGRGLWAADPPRWYRERLTFACDGRPLLRYREETWEGWPAQPLPTEAGFLRPLGAGTAELLVVQAVGFLEVERGPVSVGGLDLEAVAIGSGPCGLPLTTARRRLPRVDDRQDILVRIGMRGERPQDHVRARLRWVAALDPLERAPDAAPT